MHPVVLLIGPAVAQTRLGGDVERLCGIVPQLPAQLLDVDAQEVGLARIPRSPHLLEEPRVREQLARIGRQRTKKPAFRGGEVHRLAVQTYDLVRQVDLERTESQGRLSSRRMHPPSTARMRASSSCMANGFTR